MIKKTLVFLTSLCVCMIIALVLLSNSKPLYGSEYVNTQKNTFIPAQVAKEGVSFYHELDKPVVLSYRNNKVVVRVAAAAPEAEQNKDRLPLNIAIVMDRSGSMQSQNKMENAKQGAIEMISQLNENDIVSLVVFDTRAQVKIPAQHLTNKDLFINTIEHLSAGGSTALYSGLMQGSYELSKNASSEYLNRIVLLSDGMANIGPTSNEDIFQLGESVIANGNTITTIGLGLSFNEELLDGLAVNSGGNYYYTNSSDELPGIFNQEINKSITMMAKDIRIKLYANNGTKALGVIGPSSQFSSHMVETWIPFLYGGETKYRLIEIDVPSAANEEHQPVGRIAIEYFDPFDQTVKHHREVIHIDFTNNNKLVKQSENKSVIKDAYLRRAAQYKEDAVKYARLGNYQNASKILLNSSKELEKAAVLCDNDKDLYRASKANQRLSRDVYRQKGYSREIMKSEVLNIHQEFWGN